MSRIVSFRNKTDVLFGIIFLAGLVVFASSSQVYGSPEVEVTGLDTPENITNEDGASFDFKVSEPSKVKEISLELVMADSEGPQMSVHVNGMQAGVISDRYHEINLEQGEFSEQNTVIIEREEIGFVDQSLVGAKVKVTERSYSDKFLAMMLLSLVMIIAPIIYAVRS